MGVRLVTGPATVSILSGSSTFAKCADKAQKANNSELMKIALKLSNLFIMHSLKL